jgi:formylaminopyrimidine deformylase / aminopyrimidine aminohydrolase
MCARTLAAVPVADLPRRHAAAWACATQHPFLVAVRDGMVPERAFNAWLVQDYRFVCELLRFQARLLGRAPRRAQPVLVSGAAALVDELTWFEEQANVRGCDLRAGSLPATAAYVELLERLDGEDFPVALAALWALERVYLDAWSCAAPGAPAYREFVGHWTVPQFDAYVEALERAADDALGTATDEADAVFAQVIDAECRFWDMAWTGIAP